MCCLDIGSLRKLFSHWLGSAELYHWKTLGWVTSTRSAHTRRNISIDLQAGCMCQNAIGISVIIASSHGCKLFMESIQCKQDSAHIFSLTALVLDHTVIQLLGDLLSSLQTLKGGPNCSQFSNSQPPCHLLKLYLKVQ